MMTLLNDLLMWNKNKLFGYVICVWSLDCNWLIVLLTIKSETGSPFGLAAWFLLWVEEDPGSIPGTDHFSDNLRLILVWVSICGLSHVSDFSRAGFERPPQTHTCRNLILPMFRKLRFCFLISLTFDSKVRSKNIRTERLILLWHIYLYPFSMKTEWQMFKFPLS